MGIYGMPDQITNPTYTKDIFKKFIPRYSIFVDSDLGEPLFDLFKPIANDQIYLNVWGVKWELAMSYCIAHYLDILNVDRESSYSLAESMKDSGIHGILTGKEGVTYSTSEITLELAYAKFWNTTEYGRRLITLLQSQGVVTMIVVN